MKVRNGKLREAAVETQDFASQETMTQDFAYQKTMTQDFAYHEPTQDFAYRKLSESKAP